MNPPWLSVLIVGHVLAGVTAVALGAATMFTSKGPGRHPRRGRRYLIALSAVFASGTAIALTDWRHLWHLAVLGASAAGLGAVGYTARRMRPPHWLVLHIVGMAGSYTAMLTAFYVDNGPRLPLWKLLPDIGFWFLPIVVALPLTVRAVHRSRGWPLGSRTGVETGDRAK